jgi:hypothetical protein
MTKSFENMALRYQLEKVGIPSSDYSFGGLKECAYHLIPFGNKWKVFAYERGKESDVQYFDDESSASNYMLGAILFASHIYMDGYPEWLAEQNK